jgi:N-acetylmuramoyl-L-alanine amidase
MIRLGPAFAALFLLLLLPGMHGSGPAPFPAPGAGAGLVAQLPPGGGAPGARHPDPVVLQLPGGRTERLELRAHRGYPAFAASALRPLGWEWRAERGQVLLRHRTGITLSFREGSPWFTWDGELFQLAQEVYAFGDDVWLPLQVMAELLPGMLPAAYRWDAGGRTLLVEGAVTAAPPVAPTPTPTTGAAAAAAAAEPPTPAQAAARAQAEAAAGPGPAEAGARAPRSRLVVIDAGHGGDEPGAVGPGGTREKEIALAVALALARELEADPWIEVRLTRDRDVTVPIWGRGEQATAWKGDRPGVFVSIHANAVPERPTVRGFETYFLSEARTEHERRVAAAENAPLARERPDAPALVDDPFLASILRDLITHDHMHWSALLADMVQRELGTFHPGPDRGVKQGPFAVLTNALMPSVLVELGFITNREEEALMTRPEFHRDAARALARSIRAFFDRYPPGGTG